MGMIVVGTIVALMLRSLQKKEGKHKCEAFC
jgi:hypothetical protein